METILTQEAALLWLAGLERITCGYPDAPRCWCPEGDCPCHSLSFAEVHGKVFVLDLREPCSCAIWRPGLAYPCDVCRRLGTFYHGQDCTNCQGRNWIPKQGRDALHEAMHKAGWEVSFIWPSDSPAEYRYNKVRPGMEHHYWGGSSEEEQRVYYIGLDADPYLAAMEAMRAAGYT